MLMGWKLEIPWLRIFHVGLSVLRGKLIGAVCTGE